MADQDYAQFHRNVPMAQIPDSNTVPAGLYQLKVRDIQFLFSQTKKYTINGLFTISAGPLVGMNFPIVNYTIGTEEDLEANDPQTWIVGMGAREWKQLCHATRTPFSDTDDPVATRIRLIGKEFQALVIESEGKGEYVGTKQNRIRLYATLGTTVKVPTQMGGRSTATGTAPQGAPQPQTRMRPTRPDMMNGQTASEPDDIADPVVPAEVAGDYDRTTT